MLLAFLLTMDGVLIAAAALFAWESRREKEPVAPRRGLQIAAAGGVAAIIVLAWPAARIPAAILFVSIVVFGAILFIPGCETPKGTKGLVFGKVERCDERGHVFARNRLPAGSPQHERFYREHPELEGYDDRRRGMGGPLGRLGTIDNGHRPNVAMMRSAFGLPAMLMPYAVAEPASDQPPADIAPERASEIVKSYALHLGAVMAGICEVNPDWIYSRRGEIHDGNWEDWGMGLAPLPNAVVVATEMAHEMVGAGPHTPGVVESGVNYAKGSYITTILAQWFSAMGYTARADHNRHYTGLMVPLAVDAGLGELGRQGYLIAPKYGARVRLFAVMTDMPLAPDRPISLGAETFCRRCKKCGEACPSKSIPLGGQTVVNSTLRWKLNERTCFDYWGKVGTDCSVCMAICPFSRPDTPLHRVVRWFVARSPAARTVFPYVDNWLYGRSWKPRPVSSWIDYPKAASKRLN